MKRRRTKHNPPFLGIDPRAVARGAVVLIVVTAIREVLMRAVVNPYLNAALPVSTTYAPMPPVEKVVAVAEAKIGEAIAAAAPSGVAGLGVWR